MLLDGLTVFENVCIPKIIKGSSYRPMEEKAKNSSKFSAYLT